MLGLPDWLLLISALSFRLNNGSDYVRIVRGALPFRPSDVRPSPPFRAHCYNPPPARRPEETSLAGAGGLADGQVTQHTRRSGKTTPSEIAAAVHGISTALYARSPARTEELARGGI